MNLSLSTVPFQPKVLGSTPLPPPGFSAPSCSTPLNPGYVINPYLAAAYLQQVIKALLLCIFGHLFKWRLHKAFLSLGECSIGPTTVAAATNSPTIIVSILC